jgi:hypothetical protein
VDVRGDHLFGMTRVPLKRNLPGGTTTVPPPWLPAASSAAWKAAVSSLTSSPFAPKSYTLRLGSGEAKGRVEGKEKGKGAAGTKPRRKGEGRGEGLAAAAVVGQTRRVASTQRRKRGMFDGGRFICGQVGSRGRRGFYAKQVARRFFYRVPRCAAVAGWSATGAVFYIAFSSNKMLCYGCAAHCVRMARINCSTEKL